LLFFSIKLDELFVLCMYYMILIQISYFLTFILDPKFILYYKVERYLDVSMQAQILDLLVKLKRHRNISFLFIAHEINAI